MADILLTEETQLREVIFSQCIWSETYSSLKHILKRTADQLPILVSFPDNDDEESSSNIYNGQTILFFDRNVSNKMLFTPLRQLEEQPNQFEVYPRHCTFATTDSFKGVIEFVVDGHRSTRVFTKLEQLVDFTSKNKFSTLFMSRDSIKGYYKDSKSSKWLSKEYAQGSIFSAQRIHHSSESIRQSRTSTNDHLECLDEDSESILLRMSDSGRFSLIATSTNQQEKQPETFLHSTQASNISQLIKRLTPENNKNNNCVRLVRGSVPHNFLCQHLQLVRQHTHDVLVGVTQENLVVEWNLESHAPCRYAVNLNDILNKLSGSYDEEILDNYIDQSRTHYRENFQVSMQLISTRDWSAFYQYWKWTGDIHSIEKNIPYQSRQRFHLVASIQDLSEDVEILSAELKKPIEHHHHRSHQSSDEIPHKRRHKKILTSKQRSFLSGMSKLLSTPASPSQRKSRMSLSNPRPSLLIASTETLFDDSIYDSNQKHRSTPDMKKINLHKENAHRTQ